MTQPDPTAASTPSRAPAPPGRHVLVANDDGVEAPGIALLARAAARVPDVGFVTVVAPETECSGTSQHITSGKPLMLLNRKPEWAEGLPIRVFAVRGLPADCSRIGLAPTFPGVEEYGVPDLVLSGVNRGANLGHHVHYSGTVAAALEGAAAGVSAISISQVFRVGPEKPPHEIPHPSLEATLTRLLPVWLSHPAFHPRQAPAGDGQMMVDLPRRGPAACLNVNFPPGPTEHLGVGDLVLVPHAGYYYDLGYERRQSPWGTTYFWPATELGEPHPDPGCAPPSDWQVIRQGKVSVTPLVVQTTDMALLQDLGAHLRRRVEA